MHYVYIIQSSVDGSYYYGYTSRSVLIRLKEHNSGNSSYTNSLKSWSIVWFAGFVTEKKARLFEQYLKTGSGHAFSRKRLLSNPSYPQSYLAGAK